VIGKVHARWVPVLKEVGATVALDPPDDAVPAVNLTGQLEDGEAERIVSRIMRFSEGDGAEQGGPDNYCTDATPDKARNDHGQAPAKTMRTE
jgi:hypothetical protein